MISNIVSYWLHVTRETLRKTEIKRGLRASHHFAKVQPSNRSAFHTTLPSFQQPASNDTKAIATEAS